MLELAVRAAVGEVDHEAEGEPDDEAEPGLPGEGIHHGGADEDAEDRQHGHARSAVGTVGGGLERMIAPSWIVRGEYRYSDYGSRAFTLFDNVSLDSIDVTVDERASLAYVGLSRRF